ncbi:RHS repeat-associated core domain-containing protein [Embleya sp. NPDC050493]|uniref:RHS repeat-associated core domain-containing protein n=1 Tax=Embleya sp. NPDC050493 TaxID=3363989 RepID=UPI0037ABE6A7
MAGTVFALLAAAGPAQAQSWIVSEDRAPKWSPGPLPTTKPVKGVAAPKPNVRAPAGDGHGSWKPAKVTWPKALDAEAVPAPEATAPRSSAFSALYAAPSDGRVADSPIRVTTPSSAPSPFVDRAAPATPNATAAAPGKVRVTVGDRAAAEKAGVDGVLLSVARTDGRTDAGRVTVSVDYAGFRDAFGADWSTRLRLFALPECALTTPDQPSCRTKTPITTSRNNPTTRNVSASVELAATSTGRMVLAVAAADSGPSGDYKATSLAASGSWTAGGNTGSMSWTYPIAVPAAIGGTAPQLTLAYNSGAIDGKGTSTNNQASWIGEGWEYSPGFVERTYQACAKDGQDKSGEKCWSNQNSLTLSLNGRSSTLLRDDVSKVWRLAEDDGSRIELLTGASNGDDDGEHWKLTTTDGVQYFFGVGHKPATGTGPATNSTWTAPIYGNDSGEPCNKASGFDASWCQQAWRWNLDYVIDARGGMVTYTYNEEKNNYTRGAILVGSGTVTPYTRGGTLARITYGSKQADSTRPTAQIVFDTAERCLKKDGFDCDPAKMTKANAAKWPDVPIDKVCAASGTCEEHSPTFWSTRRLTKITTQILAGADYQTVDEFALGQDYPDPGDGSTATLWLKSITRTGYDGSKKIDMPSLDFTGTFMPNRVDAGGDMAPPMNRRRITTITNETGGSTTFRFNAAECTTANLPTPDTNTKACYPVWWSYSDSDPVLHWFHKYTVAEVTEQDPTTHTPDKSTRYEYVGGAAWHRDDTELTEDKEAAKPKSKDRRTWNDYRGYAEVITRSGVAPDKITQSKSLFLRGMDGDVKKDGTKRAVSVTDSAGTVITDTNDLHGFGYETQTYDGAELGNKVVATKSDKPWLSAVTATHKRARDLPDLTARKTRTGQSRSRSLLADGVNWRQTRTETTYDPTYGLAVAKADYADALDPFCTKTSYAHNTTAWIIGRPTEVTSVVGDCDTTATAATVYGLARTSYDNLPLGQVGTIGDVTSTQAAIAYKADGTPDWLTTAKTEFDAYGRTVKATDAENRVTLTTYEPAVGALPIRTTVTDSNGWSTVQEVGGSRRLPIKSVDVNGLVVEQEYDALGRLLAVWKPGHPKSGNADLQFAYDISKSVPSVVTTKTMRVDATYATSHSIVGGFLQARQTQTDTGNGASGRLIADTFYDSLGRVLKSNQTYYDNTSAPTKSLFIANDNEVPAQSANVYDGQGRKTVESFSSLSVKQWETRTAYQGADQVAVTPPGGGVATLSISDARGKIRELREYDGGVPTGVYSKITYTYTPREELKTVTDAGGNTWSYRYDFMGRTIHTDDPDKGASDTTYDKMGRVTGTTDARGQKITYTYDSRGRKNALYKGAEAKPESLLASWSYDNLAKGQKDKSTRYVDGASGAQYVSEITGFDADSYRPTGTRVTIPAAEGKLAGVYETQTSYESLTGRPTYAYMPAVGGLPDEAVTYAYKSTGQLGTLGSTTGDSYLNWSNYDVFGRNVRAILGSQPRQAAFTSSFDPATGRLLTTNWDKETATTASVDATSYTYKPSGDVTSIKTVRDGMQTDTQCFAYDGSRRLKEAWTDTAGVTVAPAPSVPGIGGCAASTPSTNSAGGPNAYWQTFDYDMVGNRIKLVEHDAADDPTKNVSTEYGYRSVPSVTRTHTLDSVTVKIGGGQPVSREITYDAAGNTETRFGTDGKKQVLTWNEENKLAKVVSESSAVSDYVYDADGNRIIRREAGKTTLYLGSDELATKTDGSGPVVGTRYYPTPGGATVVRSGNGTLTYMAADSHGTATSTLDAGTLTATRRQSKPFGEPRGSQPTQANGQWPDDKGFLGKSMDTTGLTHVGAREYDPTLGRFISVDPLMDLTDIQQIHGYTYASNSPLTYDDPSGAGEVCAILGVNDCKDVRPSRPAGASIDPPAPSNPPVDTGGNKTTGNGTGKRTGSGTQLADRSTCGPVMCPKFVAEGKMQPITYMELRELLPEIPFSEKPACLIFDYECTGQNSSKFTLVTAWLLGRGDMEYRYSDGSDMVALLEKSSHLADARQEIMARYNSEATKMSGTVNYSLAKMSPKDKVQNGGADVLSMIIGDGPREVQGLLGSYQMTYQVNEVSGGVADSKNSRSLTVTYSGKTDLNTASFLHFVSYGKSSEVLASMVPKTIAAGNVKVSFNFTEVISYAPDGGVSHRSYR